MDMPRAVLGPLVPPSWKLHTRPRRRGSGQGDKMHAHDARSRTRYGFLHTVNPSVLLPTQPFYQQGTSRGFPRLRTTSFAHALTDPLPLTHPPDNIPIRYCTVEHPEPLTGQALAHVPACRRHCLRRPRRLGPRAPQHRRRCWRWAVEIAPTARLRGCQPPWRGLVQVAPYLHRASSRG